VGREKREGRGKESRRRTHEFPGSSEHKKSGGSLSVKPIILGRGILGERRENLKSYQGGFTVMVVYHFKPVVGMEGMKERA